MVFQTDSTVRTRPTCAVERCSNNAIILVGGKFICGQCAVKWQEKYNKMVFGQLNEMMVTDDN